MKTCGRCWWGRWVAIGKADMFECTAPMPMWSADLSGEANKADVEPDDAADHCPAFCRVPTEDEMFSMQKLEAARKGTA